MPENFTKIEDPTIVLFDDKAPTITTADKLRMEANLLSTGIKQGFADRARDAWDNKAATALEFGTAALIGAGLTVMHNAGGRWGTAAKFATAGLAGLAIGDAVNRLAPTAMAMNDAWHDPSKFDQSKDIVASRLGSAFFDYPLMAAGGFTGASAAARFAPVTLRGSLSEFQAPRNFNDLGKFSTDASAYSPLNARGLAEFTRPMSVTLHTEHRALSIIPIAPISSTEMKLMKDFQPAKFDLKTIIQKHK
jgi:hypothetical protein